MGWTKEFLEDIANEYGLSTLQKQIFFLRLLEEMDFSEIKAKLDSEGHEVSESGYRKRMSSIYDKFSIQGDVKGKETDLRQLLNQKYQERNNKYRSRGENIQQHPYYPKGALRSDSPYYIKRPPLEQEAYQAILEPGNILNILGPEKTGKTSLINRIVSLLEKKEYQIINIDLTLAESSTLSDLSKFLKWFCTIIYAKITLKQKKKKEESQDNHHQIPMPEDFWQIYHKLLGDKMTCKLYIDESLKQTEEPLLVVIDDIDLIFSQDGENQEQKDQVAREFVSLLRVFFEEAKRGKSPKNLQIILARSRELAIPTDQSPFNVGTNIKLFPFTNQQVLELATQYKLNRKENEEALKQLREITNGHPYCVHLILYKMAEEGKNIEEIYANDDDVKKALKLLKNQKEN
jgi:GTPase SAR1 family protein